MAKFSLAMDSLAQLDNGLPAGVFDREVKKAIADCRDRHRLDKARTISMTVKITPHETDEEDVRVEVEISSVKLPAASFDSVRMTTNRDNSAHFRSEFNDSPNQVSLFDAANGKGEEIEEQ